MSDPSPSPCAICLLHASLGRGGAPGTGRDPAASGTGGDPDASDTSGDPGGDGPAALVIGHCGPFLLRHHPHPSPLLGWLLLDARRHLGGAADFQAPEAAAFGPVLQRASALVRELTGCQRVYALAFGEGARHLHMHLVPRHGADPASEAWRVADLYRAVASGERPPAAAAAVGRLVAQARAAIGGWPSP